jgi:sigma-E factor negative regulatory protein RseC
MTMEEIGVVIETEGIMARVRVQKSGACDACAAAGTCKPSEETAELEAFNPIMAKVGQTVRLALKPQLYLKASIIVYGLPVAALIGGAILGKNIGESYFKGTNSDLIAAAFGFGALIISFIIIKLWSSNVEKKEEYRPVIEEIIQ